MTERKHSHYFKNVAHLREVDIYRLLRLYNVTDPNIAHAIKKLLVAGGRGAGKNVEQDITEAIDTLNRYLQMQAEDCNAGTDTTVADITRPMMDVVALSTGVSLHRAKNALHKTNGNIMLAIADLNEVA